MSLGMDQTSARRKARELNGVAVSARNPDRNTPNGDISQMWRIGGWPLKDDVWIVVDRERKVVLCDHEETVGGAT